MFRSVTMGQSGHNALDHAGLLYFRHALVEQEPSQQNGIDS